MSNNTSTLEQPSSQTSSSSAPKPSTQVQPYLFFDGNCEEAVKFYQRALGAEVTMLMHYKDSPEPQNAEMCTPMSADKVMHANFRIGSTNILASDGPSHGAPSFKGFSLSLTVTDQSQAKKFFAALSDGGQIQMPLDKTFFSPLFGMVADRFGVCWMVYVTPSA